jgi:nucleoside-diphosphate-sugar epimerase
MLDNIMDLARRQRCLHRFLFASTSEVYAGTLKHFSLNIPTPENVPLTAMNLRESRTSYMLSKIYGEAMCHQSDLPFTIFRPHNIYGPRMGMSHVIPEQLQKVWEAKTDGTISVYSPEHTRTFCYIDDAVEMLKRIIESDKCVGRTLNVGTEYPEISIRELVRSCIDLSSKKLEMEFLPATAGSPLRRAPNMNQTSQLLGFSSQVELKTGLQRTWNWYREHVFQKDEITAK